jgi:hypothetical protein
MLKIIRINIIFYKLQINNENNNIFKYYKTIQNIDCISKNIYGTNLTQRYIIQIFLLLDKNLIKFIKFLIMNTK